MLSDFQLATWGKRSTADLSDLLSLIPSLLFTHLASSASSSLMAEKSAPPTPTMMTDMGKPEAQIRADLVSCMSERAPSVRSSKTKYCYGGSRWREQGGGKGERIGRGREEEMGRGGKGEGIGEGGGEGMEGEEEGEGRREEGERRRVDVLVSVEWKFSSFHAYDQLTLKQ